MSDTPEPPEKKIPRRRMPFDVRQAVREWLLQDDAIKTFSERQGDCRNRLLGVLASHGRTDEKGSQWIRFPDDPVEGRVNAIKRERRVTKRLNEERTEEYLKKRKLYAQCTEQITVLDEEKILGLAFTGTIPDADMESLYDVTESWAFVPSRVKL